MNFCLDKNVLVSLLFPDVNSAWAFHWLKSHRSGLYVGHWAKAELFALVHRWVRSGNVHPTLRLWSWRNSTPAGVVVAALARDPLLKRSATDALHLALSSHNGHILVTFDARLAEAARLRGQGVEVP